MQKKRSNVIVNILYMLYVYLKDYIFNYDILCLTKKFTSLQQDVAK
jgi:hypothetical protein